MGKKHMSLERSASTTSSHSDSESRGSSDFYAYLLRNKAALDSEADKIVDTRRKSTSYISDERTLVEEESSLMHFGLFNRFATLKERFVCPTISHLIEIAKNGFNTDDEREVWLRCVILCGLNDLFDHNGEYRQNIFEILNRNESLTKLKITNLKKEILRNYINSFIIPPITEALRDGKATDIPQFHRVVKKLFDTILPDTAEINKNFINACRFYKRYMNAKGDIITPEEFQKSENPIIKKLREHNYTVSEEDSSIIGDSGRGVTINGHTFTIPSYADYPVNPDLSEDDNKEQYRLQIEKEFKKFVLEKLFNNDQKKFDEYYSKIYDFCNQIVFYQFQSAIVLALEPSGFVAGARGFEVNIDIREDGAPYFRLVLSEFIAKKNDEISLLSIPGFVTASFRWNDSGRSATDAPETPPGFKLEEASISNTFMRELILKSPGEMLAIFLNDETVYTPLVRFLHANKTKLVDNIKKNPTKIDKLFDGISSSYTAKKQLESIAHAGMNDIDTAALKDLILANALNDLFDENGDLQKEVFQAIDIDCVLSDADDFDVNNIRHPLLRGYLDNLLGDHPVPSKKRSSADDDDHDHPSPSQHLNKLCHEINVSEMILSKDSIDAVYENLKSALPKIRSEALKRQIKNFLEHREDIAATNCKKTIADRVKLGRIIKKLKAFRCTVLADILQKDMVNPNSQMSASLLLDVANATLELNESSFDEKYLIAYLAKAEKIPGNKEGDVIRKNMLVYGYSRAFVKLFPETTESEVKTRNAFIAQTAELLKNPTEDKLVEYVTLRDHYKNTNKPIYKKMLPVIEHAEYELAVFELETTIAAMEKDEVQQCAQNVLRDIRTTKCDPNSRATLPELTAALRSTKEFINIDKNSLDTVEGRKAYERKFDQYYDDAKNIVTRDRLKIVGYSMLVLLATAAAAVGAYFLWPIILPFAGTLLAIKIAAAAGTGLAAGVATTTLSQYKLFSFWHKRPSDAFSALAKAKKKTFPAVPDKDDDKVDKPKKSDAPHDSRIPAPAPAEGGDAPPSSIARISI